MTKNQAKWSQLLARARRGDAAAAKQLHEELEPETFNIVRRCVGEGDDGSPLSRIALAVAGWLSDSGMGPVAEQNEPLLRQTARYVCDWLAGRPHPRVVERLRLGETRRAEPAWARHTEVIPCRQAVGHA